VRAGDRFICQLRQDPNGEAEADARLIARAPELLAENERLKAERDELTGAAWAVLRDHYDPEFADEDIIHEIDQKP
jgi:hypothetical protein